MHDDPPQATPPTTPSPSCTASRNLAGLTASAGPAENYDASEEGNPPRALGHVPQLADGFEDILVHPNDYGVPPDEGAQEKEPAIEPPRADDDDQNIVAAPIDDEHEDDPEPARSPTPQGKLAKRSRATTKTRKRQVELDDAPSDDPPRRRTRARLDSHVNEATRPSTRSQAAPNAHVPTRPSTRSQAPPKDPQRVRPPRGGRSLPASRQLRR